jgi:hypothetical protein
VDWNKPKLTNPKYVLNYMSTKDGVVNSQKNACFDEIIVTSNQIS